MSASITSRPIKVLIVEENQPEYAPWFQVVSNGVNSDQFESERVASLSKALVLVEKEPFDVILLDLALPDSVGIATFSQICVRVPEVPIVVTSALENKNHAFEVLREGAQDYLIKGEVDVKLLRRTLLYAIERHRSRVLLQQLSFNDELTGLLNRRGFLSMAQQQLKIAQREDWELVLLFADLDSLKNINDSFGHTEGDRALKSIATVLKKTFRTSDLIARLGGDEFIVLALNAPAAGVQTMTTRLQSNLDRLNSQNRYYQLSLSIGIAQFDPNRVVSLETMIMEADKALYENKRKRRLAGSESSSDE
ncbi:MAG: GGDEF domain-containing response regulator [Chloroflexi bacterium]|nr:GGDEF domain-containing response regulator [Chloroflexota bacterium]